jgi:hypothetical protein
VNTPAPGRVAVRLVELAARMLPSGHRARYRREFTAELYGLTGPQQLRHATQVLSRSWALRAALGEPVPARNGELTMQIVQRRPLTCLLLRWHKWQPLSTKDGARYNKCVKCGKEWWQSYGAGRNTIGL